MIVLSEDDKAKPTSFLEAIEKSRQYEFKSLVKCMNDCFVELRLLAALAIQSGSDSIPADRIKELADRYEDRSFEVMRESIHQIASLKDKV